MNLFIKSMIVVGSVAMMGTLGWSYEQDGQQATSIPRDQVTRTVDVNGALVPVEQVRYRRYYRSPYGYGWRPYYYGRPYYYDNYYGAPRAGYYDYGYGRGGVQVGPVQVWW
jgi:hypothetical protein